MRKPIVVEKQFLIMGLLCFACSCGTGGKKVVPDKAGATVIALTDSVRTDTVDLGRIHAGEVIRRDLSLRNGSDRPMIILSAATNCGCTTVDFEREPVQPKASPDTSSNTSPCVPRCPNSLLRWSSSGKSNDFPDK